MHTIHVEFRGKCKGLSELAEQKEKESHSPEESTCSYEPHTLQMSPYLLNVLIVHQLCSSVLNVIHRLNNGLKHFHIHGWNKIRFQFFVDIRFL